MSHLYIELHVYILLSCMNIVIGQRALLKVTRILYLLLNVVAFTTSIALDFTYSRIGKAIGFKQN